MPEIGGNSFNEALHVETSYLNKLPVENSVSSFCRLGFTSYFPI
jgi:hypothetical protein